MTYPVSLSHPLLPQPALKLFTHDPASDLVSAQLHREKIWELHETRLILENLENTRAFVDIGANIGYYSLIVARQLSDAGLVKAFEPDPRNFSLLQQNIEQNQLNNIEAFNLALSDHDGELSLFLSEDNKGDHRSYAGNEDRQAVTVSCRRGDTLLGTCDRIDFVKMDTQGAEQRIVEGLMETLLHSRKNLKMIVEFWPWGLRQNGGNCFELLNLLDRLDLPQHIIDHVHGGIYSSSRTALEQWMTQTEADPDNQGFINLFIGKVNA